LQKFLRTLISSLVENGPPAPPPAPSSLEQRLAAQALAIDLKLCPWAPWRLLERGQEWILEPFCDLVALLSQVRKLPLAEPAGLSDRHKAVLLVVIGHRRKGGVSRTRIGDILGLDASCYLDDLARLQLVYADPAREILFWRPRPEALLALGFRSGADIPELAQLENWFDSQKPGPPLTRARAARQLRRERKRRQSVEKPPTNASDGPIGQPFAGRKESRPDFLRREADGSLPCPGQPPERVVKGLAG
jgi:hypothetical protein